MELTSMKRDFRHLHIAYGLIRGKEYEEIERTVKEGNEPDWSQIHGNIAKYTINTLDTADTSNTEVA